MVPTSAAARTGPGPHVSFLRCRIRVPVRLRTWVPAFPRMRRRCAAPLSIRRATPYRLYVSMSSDRSARATSTRMPRAAFSVADLPAGAYRVLGRRGGILGRCAIDHRRRDGRATLTIPLTLGRVSESVVVSAAQVEVAQSDAPASVHVVTAETLRARQIDNFGDALRAVPGLSVARSGGRGALTSLFPRGGESDYTLVLVDGMRLNAFGGGMDLSQLALANVERIEVVHGAAERALRGRRHRRCRPGRDDARWPGARRGARGGRQRIDLARARHDLGLGGRLELERQFQRSASDGFTGTAAAASRSVTTTGGSDRSRVPSAGSRHRPASSDSMPGVWRANAERRVPTAPIRSACFRAWTRSREAARTTGRSAWPHSTAGGTCSPAASGSDTRCPTIISRTTSSAASALLSF